jgi:glutamate-1-semialdehyde 2,1-aminomutase
VHVVPFNDLAAVAQLLEREDVALVLTEPAMTNNHGLIEPVPGFMSALRDATLRTGSLLALDETHTLVCGPGGLTRAWGLDSDFVIVGKSIAGGVPCGAYGMTDSLAEALEYDVTSAGFRYADRIATGGTLFGNPLSIVAARATLGRILTDDAYAHTAALGYRLAARLQESLAAAGVEWSVRQLFCRCALFFTPAPPLDAAQARRRDCPLLRRWQRLFFANRGVWDAIVGAGPTVAVPATADDVDQYADVFEQWIAQARALLM